MIILPAGSFGADVTLYNIVDDITDEVVAVRVLLVSIGSRPFLAIRRLQPQRRLLSVGKIGDVAADEVPRNLVICLLIDGFFELHLDANFIPHRFQLGVIAR